MVPACCVRRAYELGDLVFKAQACEIWGLSPDLFADPEAGHCNLNIRFIHILKSFLSAS